MSDETYKPYFDIPPCLESKVWVFQHDPTPTTVKRQRQREKKGLWEESYCEKQPFLYHHKYIQSDCDKESSSANPYGEYTLFYEIHQQREF
ncbi:hypothetical protein TNCV_3902021 [Trichonephila clavipes]|nr:hypothetical protein TNCV_3902021 [Trichonephila clavipes]